MIRSWFEKYCLIQFDNKVFLMELYDHYIWYCDSYRLQKYTKKMFSILIREVLESEIKKGSVQVTNKGKVVFKGIKLSEELIGSINSLV